MAGRKLFTNRTPYNLEVSLRVRASEDPRNNAGTVDFDMASLQSKWQEYGNNVDIYLNGINLVAVFDGQIQAQQYLVVTRGSQLDNQLNMNNGVDFGFANSAFYISTRQVS